MIRVQNVYYMLAYAFQVLHEQGYKNVATEEFDNVAELLSAILCRGVSVQIKRGLIRQYISREEALASPRGKLEIGESIKTQVIRKKQLVCNYDELMPTPTESSKQQWNCCFVEVFQKPEKRRSGS